MKLLLSVWTQKSRQPKQTGEKSCDTPQSDFMEFKSHVFDELAKLRTQGHSGESATVSGKSFEMALIRTLGHRIFSL